MVGEHGDGIVGGMACVARHSAASAAVTDDRLTVTAGGSRSRFTLYVNFAADSGEPQAAAAALAESLAGLCLDADSRSASWSPAGAGWMRGANVLCGGLPGGQLCAELYGHSRRHTEARAARRGCTRASGSPPAAATGHSLGGVGRRADLPFTADER